MKCKVSVHNGRFHAFFIVIVAAASTIAAQQQCKDFIHCPCGNTGKNITVCAEAENPCSKWSDCRKCWLLGCLECSEGFEGPGLCREVRTVTKIPLQSVTSYCTDPGAHRNGKRNPPYNPSRLFRQGTRLDYFCNDDFKLDGERSVVCGTDSRWSPSIPKCVALPHTPERPTSKITLQNLTSYCTDPGVDRNGKRNPRHSPSRVFRQGTRLDYACNDDFEFSGEQTIICGTDGRWSSSIPKCVKRTSERPITTITVQDFTSYCTDPGVDRNGKRNPRYNPSRVFRQGTRLDYACNADFEIDGEQSLICGTDGRWSSSIPKCVKPNLVRPTSKIELQRDLVYCSDPGFDPNGKRNPAYIQIRPSPGTRLEYFCNANFELDRDGSIVCGTDGRWSSSIPKCVAMSRTSVLSEDECCEEPDPVTNGNVTRSFPLNHPRSCSQSTDEYEEYPKGTVLQYSCQEGYRMEGSSELYCMSSGSWTSEPPSCKTECGYSAVRASRRVTYGDKSKSAEWPWVVAISNQRDGIICGGVLLNNKVILTAAHCLTSARSYTLYFGKLHLRDVNDDAELRMRNSNRILRHPDYNNTSYDCDIALVGFAPEIHFSDRIRPICLPTERTTYRNLRTGNVGYVTGWGVNEKDLQSDQLLHAELPFQSPSDCMESLNSTLSSNMFCAGHEQGGKSACSGDSGSPFVYLNTDTSRYTLEGLVSFGVEGQCGMAKRYTTFTKVLNFVPWIMTNM